MNFSKRVCVWIPNFGMKWKRLNHTKTIYHFKWNIWGISISLSLSLYRNLPNLYAKNCCRLYRTWEMITCWLQPNQNDITQNWKKNDRRTENDTKLMQSNSTWCYFICSTAPTIYHFIISNIFILLQVTDEFMHALNILHFTLLILFRFFPLDIPIFVFYDIAPLFATQIPLMHNIERRKAWERKKFKKWTK